MAAESLINPTPRSPRRVVVRPLPLLAGGIVLLVVWIVAARVIDAPYLLPSPSRVVAALALHGPRLAQHALVTLVEVVLGFVVGFSVAVTLGYIVYRWSTAAGVVMPWVVASQAVPIVAIAPLLVLWFGTGQNVKVATAALIVFFPILVTTVAGLRGIDPAYGELMRACSASRAQILVKLEVPAALPVLLAGVRVGVTLAVIGAVVGEFVAGDRGLGAAIQIARAQFNTPLMFAATAVLVALALALYALAAGTERALLRGRRAQEGAL